MMARTFSRLFFFLQSTRKATWSVREAFGILEGRCIVLHAEIMNQAAIKLVEQEAKDALGIERGKGKRVPADRLDEFKDKVQEILKASLLPSALSARALAFMHLFPHTGQGLLHSQPEKGA
jgi:hypothetical protein